MYLNVLPNLSKNVITFDIFIQKCKKIKSMKKRCNEKLMMPNLLSIQYSLGIEAKILKIRGRLIIYNVIYL